MTVVLSPTTSLVMLTTGHTTPSMSPVLQAVIVVVVMMVVTGTTVVIMDRELDVAAPDPAPLAPERGVDCVVGAVVVVGTHTPPAPRRPPTAPMRQGTAPPTPAPMELTAPPTPAPTGLTAPPTPAPMELTAPPTPAPSELTMLPVSPNTELSPDPTPLRRELTTGTRSLTIGRPGVIVGGDALLVADTALEETEVGGAGGRLVEIPDWPPASIAGIALPTRTTLSAVVDPIAELSRSLI